MKVILSVVTFAVLLILATADTPFKLCSGEPTDAKVTKVTVPNCNAPPCEMKKGTNVSVTIVFETNKVFKSLTNKVYGEFAGIDVPFPGYPDSQEDICKLGAKCPTKAGGTYTEKVTLPVSSSDPAISVVAKWKIAGDDGKTTVGCFELPLKIVS